MATAHDLLPACATRSVITILWSAFAVILASTWASIHPDVPLPNLGKSDSKDKFPFRLDLSSPRSSRALLFIITVLWPEQCVAMALEQWQEVKLVRDCYKAPIKQDRMNAPPEKRPPVNNEWTQAHYFFLVMKGFVYEDHGQPRVLTLKHLLDEKAPWPDVSEDAINGRSRRDPLSKSLIIIQLIWFVTQLIARRAQRLAIAHVEIMALAYVLLCGVFYVLWWYKPYNVQLTIKVDPPMTVTNQTNHSSSQKDQTFLPRTFRGQLALILGSSLFGATHLLAWNLAYPTKVEHIMWISCSLVSAAGLFPGLVLLKILYHDNLVPQEESSQKNPLRRAVVAVGLFVLIICRLILFVLCFLLLRGLPETALHSISWSSFIPHI